MRSGTGASRTSIRVSGRHVINGCHQARGAGKKARTKNISWVKTCRSCSSVQMNRTVVSCKMESRIVMRAWNGMCGWYKYGSGFDGTGTQVLIMVLMF
jgi:hypothetical protein